MDEKIYNILWIDDEHEELSGIKGRARRNGLILKPFKSLKGIEELEKNYSAYDGILLDAKFIEKETDKPGSEDTDFSIQAKDRILQIPKKFEFFVLTGQAEAYEDKTFGKVFKRVYRKGIDADIEQLFNDLKEAADASPDTQIRHRYQRVFDACTINYLGEDSVITLLNIIKNAEKDTIDDSKDFFLGLRKLLELLFAKLNAIGLLPDEIYDTPGWFNPSSDYLTGKQSSFQIKSDVIHPTISFLLKQLKEVTQDAEHNINQKLRIKSDDFILHNKTPYLYRSSVNQICDVLIWFKSFVDEHQDIEVNKTLYNKIDNIESVEKNDWIIGEVYEIGHTGWGKFISRCGKIDLSIPEYMMGQNNLKVASQIQILTKPGNNKHIKEIRKI